MSVCTASLAEEIGGQACCPECGKKNICGARRTKRGGICHRSAGWNTPHRGSGTCRFHGGLTQSHQKKAERQIARAACDRLGIPIEIDPAEALLQELFETQGNIAFYRALINELPTHPEPDRLVAADKDAGLPLHWEPGKAGVYAPKRSAQGFPTGEAMRHVLVELYMEERKHRAVVAAAALRAGIEERRMQIAEGYAEQIAQFARGLLSELGIDPASEKARKAMRNNLTVIAGGQAA